MKTNHINFLLLFTLLFSVAQTAFGQTSTAHPECARDPACLSIFSRGRQYSSQGNLREALRLYLAAYEVSADPAIFFNIARILQKQGQPSMAALHYRRFIDSPVDDPEQKRKAQDYLNQLPLEESHLLPFLARSAGITEDLYGAWGINENNIWVVGDRGSILKWNGVEWTPQSVSTTRNLLGIWGSDANNVWAIG